MMRSNVFFFISIIYFCFFVSAFLNTFASSTHYLCRLDQKNALLEFKNEFSIEIPYDGCFYPTTKSWKNNSDCCSWDGVMCDIESGLVTGLDLNCSGLYGTFNPNSSLFRLNHLRSLNLAYNDFNGSSIPSEFSRLTRLTLLKLSNSWLSGQIPAQLFQLTELVSLDLSSDNLSIEMPFFSTLAMNLTNLRELRLSYTNISSTVSEAFANMSSLRLLHLDGCNLYGKFPDGFFLLPHIASIVLSSNDNLMGSLPEFPSNSSLRLLDLSHTSFSGSLPDSIGNLKSLYSLNLSETNFYGSLPDSVGNLKSLNSLVLSSSNFSGILPDSIGNLTSLKSLDLSFSNFCGEVPSSIGSLNQLTELWFSSNNLTGNFPLGLLNLTRLSTIYLDNNEFTGPLPSDIGNLSQLCLLDVGPDSFEGVVDCPELNCFLDGNNLSGPIPRSISKLVNLKYLDLSFLSTNDTTDFSIFSDLKSLKQLSLSGNSLSFANVNSTSHFPLHLEKLDLSACNITEFPDFLRAQQDLWYLDLSSNKIKGQVPKWLWRLPMLENLNISYNSFNTFEGSPKVLRARAISVLDLSSNAFQGSFPVPPVSTYFLSASANNFVGKIPWPICKLSALQILDLSKNNFSGPIPQCLGNFSNSLSVMNLRRNNLSRSLPDTFVNGSNLITLDIGHNQLTGKLPKSLINCTSLRVLNMESNRFNDIFPFWLEALQELEVLVLRSNVFHGSVSLPSHSFQYPKLQIIDISHNDFTGSLPMDYFVNWEAMSSIRTIEDDSGLYLQDGSGYYSMVFVSKGVETEMIRIFISYTAIDFSGNKLRGQIPESIGLLKGLIVLNLSGNAFTDHIPPSLANLTELESLDLSQNRLSGKIPPELGSLTFLEYINVSHNQLVGPLPQATQFERQNSSSFEGNPRLCGPPLQRTCAGFSAPSPPANQPMEHKEEVVSWIAAAIGYAPGLVFGLTIGKIVTSYKHEWFMKFSGRNNCRSTGTR